MTGRTDPHSTVRAGLSVLLERLWRFAISLCGQRDVAEELVQATCVRALERASQFVPGTRLDRWTFSIMASIWKNRMRAEAVRRGNGQVDAVDALTADLRGPMEATILSRQVLSKVGQLPEAQRAVVVLVYGEGMSYRDAAAVLEIPVGTVMSRLAAAKAALRQTLSQDSSAPSQQGGGAAE